MFNLKRLIFTMFIVLICGFAHSQSGYVYSEQLFDRAASRSIFVCSDNSVVVLGNSDDTFQFHSYYATITKLDPDGNLLWRQWLNPDGYMFSITGIDIDTENTVTFIFAWIATSLIQLATIDSDEVVAPLSDPIDIPYFAITFNKALRTPNNEIVAVGKAFQDNNLFYDVSSACYFRFSSAGDTLATAFWPVDPASQYHEAEAYDLALMDNGNILIACKLHSFNCSILEVNPDGTLVNRFDLPGQDHSFNVSICRELNSPSYIIAYTMGEYPDYSIHVDRFENGVFEPLFSISESYLTAVNSMILGTDNIYLCGRLSVNGSLLSLTYSGELNWSWAQPGYNHSSEERYGSASAALLDLDSDGNIYWAWSGELLGTQIITKLLPNGQLPIDDEVQAPPVNTISAYPNPMKDQSSIVITNVFDRYTTITIFDIKGNKLAECERYLTCGQHEYKIAGLSAGLYFVRVNAGDKLSQCKIISMNHGKENISLSYMGQNNSASTSDSGDLKYNPSKLKGSKGTIQMAYTNGEMLIIRATSGVHSTVRTMIPSSDLTVQCIFVSCTDYDNISYSTVKIGTQTWMAENLRSKHASNGNLINWGVYDYNNNPANSLIYGKLYTWRAIMDGASSSNLIPSGVKGICPNGWHLPSKAELDNLVSALGPSSVAGGKLKEGGTSHWTAPNTGATNSSGFSSLPAGFAGENANVFGSLGIHGYLWSSTEYFANNGWSLSVTNTGAHTTVKELAKTFGFSCRCIKD